MTETNQQNRQAARVRRRAVKMRRRAVGIVTLLLPAAFIFAMDLARRGPRIVQLTGADRWLHLSTVVASFCFWGLLLYVAAQRRGWLRTVGGLAFVTLFTLSFAVQNAFFDFYRVYVAIDPLVFGDDIPRGIFAALPLDRPPLSLLLTMGGAVALGMLVVARRFVRPDPTLRRPLPYLAAAFLVLAFAAPISPPVPVQAASPDFMYFHGVAVFIDDRLRRPLYGLKPQIVRVQRRTPELVPPLNARPPTRRNLVLLLQEAQRTDVTCIEYDPGCSLATRSSNPLLPHRLPFFQARAASSSTAVAVAVLWSGTDPTASYERIHSAPLLWEYARAAGYDTAYWTSQNLMFGNARLWTQDVPLSCFATGTEIDPGCDVLTGANDDDLVERVAADWPKLQEPFVAVVHFSNIHRPRVVDPKDAPFQPTHLSDLGTGGEEGRNHYKNAVHRSDRAVARLIRHIRSSDSGRRTVLVYTADHGEAFGEHKNENDHSSTVFDEEIRVPLWIDAPDGVLSNHELSGYRRSSQRLISQYDQAATLFALLGIWDSPGFSAFRTRMLGTPIDRPAEPRAVPLTNVSWVWEYHRPNWGLMLGPLKVLAQIEDEQYSCFDLRSDPLEQRPLHNPACAGLIAEAGRVFGMLPKDMRRLRDRPDWGRAGAATR